MTTQWNLNSEETEQLFERFVIPNYRRYPVNLVRGAGSLVWDSEDNEYLDFFPGWGCNLLGHCPARVVEAVQRQVATLIHVPNTWHTHLQGLWAKLLVERSFDGQAFFCNSGAEANEAAIKLARLHQGPEKYKIITFQGGFHGRTLGALAATAQPKYHVGLGPMVAGFVYAPPFNLSEVEKRIDDATAAIMIEPIQGESGVRVPTQEYLQGLRDLADKHGLLLIFDEVQSGCGRTGEWFAYQYFGVQPDVMTLAKSLCGGVAGGAMIARREVAPSLRAGMHASTFGGNPIAAAAGIAMIETIEADGLLDQAKENSGTFARRLAELSAQFQNIREVRQVGLMIGIELDFDGSGVVQSCLDRGLLINCTNSTVLRLLPAMNITEDQIDRGMSILADAMSEQVSALQPESLSPNA
jgi:acetylornithine/N-succinyldiaminopimelate aminotransferase